MLMYRARRFVRNLNPFRLVGDSGRVYARLAPHCETTDVGGQTNLVWRGHHLADHQPNMIGEPGDPDFYRCRAFLRWFIR